MLLSFIDIVTKSPTTKYLWFGEKLEPSRITEKSLEASIPQYLHYSGTCYDSDALKRIYKMTGIIVFELMALWLSDGFFELCYLTAILSGFLRWHLICRVYCVRYLKKNAEIILWVIKLFYVNFELYLSSVELDNATIFCLGFIHSIVCGISICKIFKSDTHPLRDALSLPPFCMNLKLLKHDIRHCLNTCLSTLLFSRLEIYILFRFGFNRLKVQLEIYKNNFNYSQKNF